MTETLKFSCSDGVVVEADKKVMTYSSRVVRDLLDTVPGTNCGTIPFPYSSRILEVVIGFCQDHYERGNIQIDYFDFILEGSPSKNPRTVHIPPQTSRKTPEEELKFHKDMFSAKVLKDLAAYNWEEIMGLHKVAKFLDIKFLQELTEALIIRAPSKEFMEMVSPWVDYNSLEAYRSHHVEAC